MHDINKILSGLTPEKRALLEKKIKEDSKNYGLFPLSFSQRRLWFLDQLDSGNANFNIPVAIRLKGELNREALQESIYNIIERHEVLRSNIVVIADTPLQIINKDKDFDIEEIDLTDSAENEKEDILNNKIREISKCYIPLNQFPLFKIILFNIEKNHYVLFIVLHHIISDGWSVGLLIRELSILYSSHCRKTIPVMPELTIQYADYSSWQNEWIKTSDYKRLLNYWKELLKTETPKTILPTDFVKTKTNQSNTIFVTIDSQLSDRIKRFCEENRATFFTFFAAVIKTFIYKYSAQTELIIGTPVANRNKIEIQNLLGFFVNILVLKSKLQPEKSFNQFFETVKENILSALDHQDMPFELLVEEIQPERDLTSTPLFNVFFSYTNKTTTKLKLPNIELSEVNIDFNPIQYDLTFNVFENESNQFVVGFEYDQSKFLESKIRRMSDNFLTLIDSITLRPENKISDLDIISASDISILKNLFHEETVKDNITSIDLFEDIVKKYPSKIALRHKGRDLTYSQLNKRINQIGNYLANELNIRNSLVGVFFDNSIEYILSILALLKSGNAFVPIDIKYPKFRVQQILNASRINKILSSERFSDLFPFDDVEKILLESEWDKIDQQDDNNPNLPIDSNSLAYCIFTSGSTGIPKGVMTSHLNLSTFSSAALNLYGVTSEDVILQFASTSFDTVIEEVFVSLLSGATMVVKTDDMLSNAEEFVSKIKEAEVTVLDLPTAYFSQLSRQINDRNITFPEKVRKIIVGGEKLNASVFKEWYERFGNEIDFFNGYGPTEITVIASAWKSDKSIGYGLSEEIPIGKALSGYYLYVLDESFNLSPVGSIGELYVGGNGVSLGYLNDSLNTANKFFPDRFSKKKGSKLYRTGDLVKVLEDGNIEFVGRTDNQIKVRGFRIELSEISKCLNSHDKIDDSYILHRKISADNSEILAYVISEHDLDKEVREIRKYLRERLPHYMLPTRYFQINELPITVNGKINEEKLLSVKDEIVPEGDSDNLTNVEARVLQIVEDLIKKTNISITDNFFEIGGHSLIAVKVSGKIQNEFKVEFPVVNIFDSVDLRDISLKIERTLKNDENICRRISVLKDRQHPPLSFAQQRLWFLNEFEPNNSVYNIPSAVRIKGKFKLDLFRKSIDHLVERHEILRTSFETHDGIPYQQIHDVLKVELNVVDISGEDESEKEQIASEICRKESKREFNLKKLPLFNITPIIIAPDEFIIFSNIHHIISDGWTSGIILREIAGFYKSYLNETEIKIAELPVQYADYSSWQRDWLKGDEYDKYLKFWKNYLSSSQSIIKLPLDKERPGVQTNNGKIFSKKLLDLNGEEINKILKDSGSTHFMFFLAVFYLLLYRLTNQEDLIVGIPVANRDLPELQDLVGLFVNTIVIRADLSENPAFRNLLNYVKESSLKAYEHKEFPFEKILDAIKLERHTSYSPLFQVMFTFNHYDDSDASINKIDFNEFHFNTDTSKFDLSITVQETAEKDFNCGFEYNTDLFNESTMEKWLTYYNNLIKEVISDPDDSLTHYSLADNNISLKPTSFQYDYISLTERISDNADRIADKTALISGDRQISYSNLEKYINIFAGELNNMGVKAGDFVGLYLDRSPEAIIAMFSIMKVGAAFIPLDIKSPQKRNDDIISDAKISFIITSSNYNLVQDSQVRIINFDALSDLNEIKAVKPLQNKNVHKELAAYVIYTSGTSGKPKGVLVSNENISSFVQAAVENYKINENDRILQFASFSFDTALEEIFPILFAGGTLILRDDEMIGSKESLLESVETHGITILDLPTAFWQNFINEIISANLSMPKCVKKIIIGGEKANRETVRKWLDHFAAEIDLLNTYGPTEATVVASSWPAEDIPEYYFNEVPIGTAFGNSQLYVLDGNLKEVPENVVGILYIGGDGISYGYLNDSGKTANGFIPDPFSPRPGMRLYKTGDLVRRLPSGNIEYIGRVDNQIKIRGFRVEINEIENAVNKLPQITETAVVVNVSKEKERLVCFYVCDNEISYNEFVRKLKGLLPDYMIPSAFVKIEKLPITINGKIDRKNLAEREFIRSSDTRIIVDPNTEKEKILFDIWRKVLKTEKFGITDNFFELGGDSIIGIQIISEARQNGLLIKPIHLFQYQTIKDLAVAAEDTDKIFAEQGLVVGDSDLTPIQKSFFEMNFHNPNHWNQSLLLKVDDILDIDILKSTVLRLLEHHDALRIKATYDKKLNEYRQIFSDEINQNVFEYYEINGLDDQRTKIEKICSAVQSSLDLERGEIIKIAYIRINNKEGRLLFVIHHIAVDGVSWRILIEDFQTIYTQLLRKSDIIIPAKTTSFKDWSKNLKTYLNSEKIDEELEYWLNISKDINKHLPVDYNNGLNDERSSKNIEIELSAEETEHLTKDVHSKYNTKINDILLTALIRSYAGWTGKRSLTINMENHGRDLPIDGVDVSRTVGWFTSIYPCHLDLRKTVDPADAIKNIKEQLRLIPNNGNKYGLLRFLLNDMDRVNQLKVFDDIGVTFNYLGQTDNLSKVQSLFSIAAENKGNERDENNLRESLIDITGIISGGKMRLSFSFSNNIFNESTITEWAKLYIKELKDLILHCLSVTERSFTSSDFNLSNLNDKKLEKVLNKVKKKK